MCADITRVFVILHAKYWVLTEYLPANNKQYVSIDIIFESKKRKIQQNNYFFKCADTNDYCNPLPTLGQFV